MIDEQTVMLSDAMNGTQMLSQSLREIGEPACIDAANEIDALAARLAEAERDAARYRHMRNNASFRDRNGPGLYWYLPRFLPGDGAEQLDAAIDAQITTVSASGAQK